MKKIILTIYIVFVATIAHAQSCPDSFSVYKEEHGILYPVAPPGWRFSGGSKEIFGSHTLYFKYGSWEEKRYNPLEEKRVLCVYGDTDFNQFFVFATINTIDRSQFQNHPEWKQAGNSFNCRDWEGTNCRFD